MSDAPQPARAEAAAEPSQGGPTAALVSAILQGTAPSPVKLAAARGALPLPRADLLRILVALIADADPGIRGQAQESLAGWPPAEAARLAADPGTAPEVLAYLLTWPGLDETVLPALVANPATPPAALEEAARGMAPQLIDLLLLGQTRLIESPEILAALETNPRLKPLQRNRIGEFRRHFLQRPVAPKRAPEPPPPPQEAEPEEAAAPPSGEPAAGEDTGTAEPIPEEEIEEELLGVYQRILGLNVNQKITLAARGDREERLILIRDANRSVQEAVINSPKITENEVESIAKMRNVKDVVLRRISNRRDWMKRYAIVRGLVTNPKTPLPVSMPLLKRLNLQDLKLMIRDRNLPEMLRRLAKKALDQRMNHGR